MQPLAVALDELDPAEVPDRRRRSTSRARFAATATATTAQNEYVPSLTLKPANSIVGSDGNGMPMLSSVMSTKIPARPMSSTTSVTKSASLSVTDARTKSVERGTRRGG